ncbi:hypothetical protein B2G71_01355 [Novosphingobium sp. PC22D]|uniref:hypothetical protein n=1 Tax=Novosphingobium sp. PC22D TaxID=1962403 RepID=UPI000BF15477|nr:hypothetical protein [Novosphingobium sp. PC22D]PEQ14281.1 hypothetical protein B2G71_01355 [Novosphingobium sp. PC22D]
MYKLKESSIHVVGADCRAAVDDFDAAYATSLRLAADTVEGLRHSGLPSSHSQRLYRTFSESFNHLLAGRKSLVAAIGQLQVIHKRSDQAETSGGCPVPWEDVFFTTAQEQEEIDQMRPSRANDRLTS